MVDTVQRVSLRGAKRRGNLKAVTDGKFRMNDTSLRLPRPLRGLAMTGEIEAQAQTIDHICHCEASKKPWQSVPRAGSSDEDRLPKERISGLALSLCPALRLCKGKCLPSRCGRLTPPQAALPCGPRRFAPRNDTVGGRIAASHGLLAMTDGGDSRFMVRESPPLCFCFRSPRRPPHRRIRRPGSI